ncbi:hypothetical protein [Morganella morganii]|uniref:hypothetical protein n=1 Tax=Morganella morganii TaxID=582 RepID=UPI003EBEB3B3
MAEILSPLTENGTPVTDYEPYAAGLHTLHHFGELSLEHAGGWMGNWLHQSMDDRAEEAVAALTLLQSLYQNTPVQIGFLGFSQAGWVIPAIPQMNGRVLAVWGAEDLNVDARRNACRYQSLLKDNPKTKVIVFPQAGHGLLQAPAYNYQLSSDWPVLRQWQFLYAGREAYHPGALSLITDWIKNKIPDLTAYYPVCQS